MSNNTDTNQFDGSGSEANGPSGDSTIGRLKGQLPMTKLKEYGQKAYAPLINVVTKYQDEITPFITALVRGLQGGVDALSKEGASDADRVVAGWFREAGSGLDEARGKLESKDVRQLLGFIEDQSRKHPGLMFSSSYLTGLFFGRISKHIGRKGIKSFRQREAGVSEGVDFGRGDQLSH